MECKQTNKIILHFYNKYFFCLFQITREMKKNNMIGRKQNNNLNDKIFERDMR